MDPTGRSQRINGAGARHFGISGILFQPKAGGSASVRGVFRRTFAVVDPETGAQVQSALPVLIVEDSQLPGGIPALEGDAFTMPVLPNAPLISLARYLVKHREVEGEGTTRYHLRLV